MNVEPRRRHHLPTLALAGMLAALPAWGVAQEAYAGPEVPPPPHLATPAAPPASGADAPYTRNWRDNFTPFEDPSRTEPARLGQPLSVPLPPDLLAAPTGAQEPGGLAEGEALAEWACASRADASRLEGGQWALDILRADQPQADAGAAPGDPLLALPTAIPWPCATTRRYAPPGAPSPCKRPSRGRPEAPIGRKSLPASAASTAGTVTAATGCPPRPP